MKYRSVILAGSFLAIVSLCDSQSARAWDCNSVDFKTNLGWCCHNRATSIRVAAQGHDSWKIMQDFEACFGAGSQKANIAWACYNGDPTADKSSIWQAGLQMCSDTLRGARHR
jgi:hypothetical protein